MSWFLVIILLLVLVILGYDYLEELKNWIGRIKIGRVQNTKEWKSLIESVISKWIEDGTPEVPLNENKKFRLIELIKEKKNITTVAYWQDASVLKAATKISSGFSEEDISDFIQDYIDLKSGAWVDKPKNVDCAMLCFELLCNEKIDNNSIKPAMDYMAEFLKNQYTKYDVIPYNNSIPDIKFVDTIGMVCPFLIKYALTYDCDDFIDIAVNQIKAYYENGFSKIEQLPFHCYDEKTKSQLGVCGWARGCAWWMVGLTDSLMTLLDSEGNNSSKALILKYLISAMDSVKKYQREDGAFGRFIQINSLEDSSAAAMFAYCFAVIYKLTKNEEYKSVAISVIEHLKNCTRRDGVIDYSQGDTHGIGMYSESLGVVPAAQGFAVSAVEILAE